jgi:hypothetical protein
MFSYKSLILVDLDKKQCLKNLCTSTLLTQATCFLKLRLVFASQRTFRKIRHTQLFSYCIFVNSITNFQYGPRNFFPVNSGSIKELKKLTCAWEQGRLELHAGNTFL